MLTKQVFLLSAAMLAALAQNRAVQVNGTPIGAEKTLNLLPGNGIMHTCVDNRAQNRVDCTPSFNTAMIPTYDTIHSNENYCASTNGTVSYTCKLPHAALTSYRTGMTFVLNVDADCAAYCTLNMDGVGIVSIKQMDGETDPGGALKARQPQWIFYDGKVFRLMGSGDGEPAHGRDQRGDVRARRVIAAMDTISYQANMTLDVTAGDLHRIRTTPAAGNAVLNAATGGLPGQHMWIIVSNDAVSAKTISFGSNLLSSGPVVGTSGKSATLQFVSDGTAWFEVSRTTGL